MDELEALKKEGIDLEDFIQDIRLQNGQDENQDKFETILTSFLIISSLVMVMAWLMV